MTTAFGELWIKHRVPEAIRTRWTEKQTEARKAGRRDHRLVAFADFTDHVPIITRKDNWREVFEPVFRRREFVSESFRRLYPIRVCTMHARLITQEDELYLHVEVKGILAAIGLG